MEKSLDITAFSLSPLIGNICTGAISMVTGSVDAFVRQDVTLAHQVIAKDDVVDEDFRKVKATLIDWIAQRPDDGEYALDLLMIAKYFERIGDHATNIAGWVVFAVTGTHEGEEN
jgi:phosphate transport system protein